MRLKLGLELDYLRTASFAGDCRIVCKTFFRVFNLRKARNDSKIKESLPFLVPDGSAQVPTREKGPAVAAEPGD